MPYGCLHTVNSIKALTETERHELRHEGCTKADEPAHMHGLIRLARRSSSWQKRLYILDGVKLSCEREKGRTHQTSSSAASVALAAGADVVSSRVAIRRLAKTPRFSRSRRARATHE